MLGISKRFPGVLALDQVDFEAGQAEVHGLVGENGAGKSTLLKILSGVYQRDEGTVRFAGRHYEAAHPRDAQEQGVAIIYQELNLIPDVSFTENIFAGRLPTRWGVVDWAEARQRSVEALSRLGLSIDPRTRIKDVGVGIQQLVEIARALSARAKLILMDEPTSALSDQEIERLFDVIRAIKQQGVSVVYISHRLDEIFEICDRVTVLRDGRKMGTKTVGETTRDELIEMMVGRQISSFFPKANEPTADEMLRVENLSRGRELRDINLTLKAGEIVGVAGLMGAGRTELARAIFGADPVDRKRVSIQGRSVAIGSPSDAIRAGIVLLTEDRRGEGLFMGMSLADNMAYPILRKLARLMGLLDHRRKRELCEQRIDELHIVPPRPEAEAGTLSGGNQQKVVLGKWLNTEPKVIILDEPTRGIDVGAKAEIHALMSDLANDGVGILMISSELPEILGMSDRVLVMRQGEIAKELSREEATQQEIMHWAIGEGRDNDE